MPSTFPRLSCLLVASVLHAAPLWTHLDSSGITNIDPAGPVASLRTGLVDSAWMQVRRPDGSVAWSRGIALRSSGPQRSPRVQALVPAPGGGWVVALDSSSTRMNGSAVFRFDSTGNLVGTPFGFAHDTCLELSVVPSSTGTWMAAVSDEETGTTVRFHDAEGALADSMRITGPGFRSLHRFGTGTVALFKVSADTVHTSTFFRIAPVDGRLEVLGVDTIVHPGYFEKVRSLGEGLGERMVFLSDTGRLAISGTRRPRTRVTVWSPGEGGFTPSLDTTVDLLLPQDAWPLPGGGMRIVGSREILPPVGAFRSEVAFVDLGPTGAVLRSRQLRTGASPAIGVVSVVTAGAPDGGRGFVGRTSSGAPDTLIELDANGDSLRSMVFPTRNEVNLWVLQEGGTLISRGMSNSGGEIAVEAWDVSSSAGVRRDAKATERIRALPGRIELELATPVRAARLRIVDARGSVLSDRDLGALDRGLAVLPTDGRGVRWVVVELDGRTLGCLAIDP